MRQRLAAFSSHPQFAAYFAFVFVCFIWGTSYLAIRIGLEYVSPATLMFVRYTTSGVLLLTGARIKRAHVPGLPQFLRIGLYGVMAIGIGTGALAYAQVWIPSGLAALFVTTQPFWMVGIEAMLPSGERLHWAAIGGMLVGISGVAFLIAPVVHGSYASLDTGHAGVIAGFLLLQVGQAGWTAGTLAQRRLRTKTHPIVSGAIHQVATGLVFGAISLFDGQPAKWELRGIAALAYLTIFNSALGYSAFSYAVDRLPIALVSLYTYVNPIVAVALGWLFYRESFGWREVIAMTIIFAGVAIVKKASRGQKRVPRTLPRESIASLPVE